MRSPTDHKPAMRTIKDARVIHLLRFRLLILRQQLMGKGALRHVSSLRTINRAIDVILTHLESSSKSKDAVVCFLGR